MGEQQHIAPQKLGERISFWKNEQATSWLFIGLWRMGHPFCMTLLLPWPFLTHSVLATCNDKKNHCSVLSSAIRQGKERSSSQHVCVPKTYTGLM